LVSGEGSSPHGPKRGRSGSPTSSSGWSAAATRVHPALQAAVRNRIGADLSVRRELVHLVGGFDEALGHVAQADDKVVTRTADDTEVCIRVFTRVPSTLDVHA
jgi:hypothetical protein